VQTSDLDEVMDGLAAGVLPEQVPDWPRVASLVGAFPLLRSLFYNDVADTSLKLITLFSLAKVPGRFGRDRIRTLVPMVGADRLESIVRSLYEGGWLELRASDNTYRIAPLGLYLLQVLSAADFAGQTPSNLLIRAAEAVAFGDRVDADTTGHLLAMLLGELETQAERAREILGRGTPRQLVRFSRQEVADQIRHVQQVLSVIEERAQAGSEHFARIVRIHEALQDILRAHEGLGRRLSEWNLKRLETSDAGYSLAALGDAVLGASDAELLSLATLGIVIPNAPVAFVATEQLLTRHRTTRASMGKEKAAFVYEAPVLADPTELALEDVDPVARLRARLAGLVETDDAEAVTSVLLSDVADFADAAWLLSLVARIEGESGALGIEVAPGVRIRLHGRAFDPELVRELPAADAIQTLVAEGILVAVPDRGLHPSIRLSR
jgi:hypothetical protein